MNISSEGRLGDERAILDTLEHGDARLVGDIDQYFTDISPHRHLVELAYAKLEIGGPRNDSKLIVLSEGGDEMLAVFKSESPKSKAFRDANELGDDHPRERAAYLVSKHFEFDLVPPTTVRDVENKNGSVQEFISRDEYRVGDDKERTTYEQIDAVEKSADLGNLCILDWIIGNGDRHSANYLVKINPTIDAEKTIIAIDNG